VGKRGKVGRGKEGGRGLRERQSEREAGEDGKEKLLFSAVLRNYVKVFVTNLSVMRNSNAVTLGTTSNWHGRNDRTKDYIQYQPQRLNLEGVA
jgi:hypothetical protein